MGRKKSNQALTMSYAIKSFVGFLEGTGKAKHTISSYRSDLNAFQGFLEQHLSSDRVVLSDVTSHDLDRYFDYLKSKGDRTNTRRRKLLTVRRLFRYLNVRKKTPQNLAQKLPAPYKVERVPKVTSVVKLRKNIQLLPEETEIDFRNKVLFWTLLETGCQVSELTRLRFLNWTKSHQGKKRWVEFEGKQNRKVQVSDELFDAVIELKGKKDKKSSLFLGFNKFGPLGSSISSRGVELLVKSYAGYFEEKQITPRMLRHCAVLNWYKQGVSRDEIQRRLGLKTGYSFRVYEPLFKKADKTASISTH